MGMDRNILKPFYQKQRGDDMGHPLPVGELRGRRDNKQPGIGQRGLGIEAQTDWISKDLLQEKKWGGHEEICG